MDSSISITHRRTATINRGDALGKRGATLTGFGERYMLTLGTVSTQYSLHMTQEDLDDLTDLLMECRSKGLTSANAQ